MSSETIKSVDAAQYLNKIFFRMVIGKPGGRAKIRSNEALSQYIDALKAEIKEAQGRGEDTTQDREMVAVDGAGSKGTVNATKRLFIPIAATKENGRQVINDPIDRTVKFLSDMKTRLTGRFSSARPSGIMDGLFVLAENKVQQYTEEIDAVKSRLELEYLPDVENGYEEAIERARTTPLRRGGLGPLFNRADYLPVSEFVEAFKIDVLWLKLSAADNVSEELKARFREDLTRRASDATEELLTALRVEMQGLFTHAVEVLTPGEDGKTKKFHESSLENIKSFLAVFQDRDLFNDDKLAPIVEQARRVITGISAEDVRKSASVREAAAASFSEIKAQLDGIVTVQAGRKFDLSPD